jgi:hypothetical protein
MDLVWAQPYPCPKSSPCPSITFDVIVLKSQHPAGVWLRRRPSLPPPRHIPRPCIPALFSSTAAMLQPLPPHPRESATHFSSSVASYTQILFPNPTPMVIGGGESSSSSGAPLLSNIRVLGHAGCGTYADAYHGRC